jgi:hypothetical protein
MGHKKATYTLEKIDHTWSITISQEPERLTASVSAEIIKGKPVSYAEMKELFKDDGLLKTVMGLGPEGKVVSDRRRPSEKPMIVITTKFSPQIDYVHALGTFLSDQGANLPPNNATQPREVMPRKGFIT